MIFNSTDELLMDYYRINSQGHIKKYAARLFIESVKLGSIDLAKTILPMVENGDGNANLILYKGRFFSQIGNYDKFFDFFDLNHSVLKKNKDLSENILPWIWRMGINKANINDFKDCNYYFDMHKEISLISKHEMAHYFQCYGAVIIIQDENNQLGNRYLSEAIMIYFQELYRNESFHSIIDNIRCIIMNIFLQGILDLQTNSGDVAYKKFTYCKLWFRETRITPFASGISEIVSLVKHKYPEIVKYVFNNEFQVIDDISIQKAIFETSSLFNKFQAYDISFIRRVCIELNEPVKSVKYFFMEGLKMQSKKVFVVEGRNKSINNAMFAFLTSVDLEPIEWEQARMLTGKSTPYIGEILDYAFSNAQAILVLLTPDEECKLSDNLQTEKDDSTTRHQPRPNVIFEAGAAFAKNPDRTILVAFGDVDLWSDIAGRHIVNMDNSAQRRQILIDRLNTAGCAINVNGKLQWIQQGDFNI